MTPQKVESERYTTYIVGVYDIYKAIINKMLVDKNNRYIHSFYMKELFDRDYVSVCDSSFIREYMNEISSEFNSQSDNILIDIKNEDGVTIALEVLK